MEINDEKRIIENCQQGDVEAFGILYEAYIKKIYDFIFYRTMHRQIAEDLTSQTFFKALKNIKKYNAEKGSFSTWLYQIARNTVIDNYRKAKPEIDLDKAYDLSSNENMTESIDHKQSLEKVEQYLSKLSPEQRELITMRLWDSLTFKEIAEITGKTEASCKMTVSRILVKMRMEMTLITFIIASLFLR